MSLRKTGVFKLFAASALLAGAAFLAVPPAWAQYPGQVSKAGKDAPVFRAVGVLEWTGEEGKPKASRLVPITVFDGQQLQDAGIYLARPEPFSLAGEVEYELKQDGKTIGLYDIRSARQEQGSWVGYGAWKPLPTAHPRPKVDLTDAKIDVADDDHPVLHRKHHAGDAPSGGSSTSSGDSGSAGSAPADPDRPTLHKKDDSGSSTNSSASSAPAPDSSGPVLHKKNTSDNSSDTSTANTSPASPTDSNGPVLHKRDSSDSTADTSATGTTSSSDSDRPTLHKKSSDDDSTTSSTQASDLDRPTLKKSKKKKQEDVASVESLPDVSDPGRPRLKRGKYDDQGLEVTPSLVGLPQDLQQTVAVSDAKNTPDHPWDYSWANPDDEAKMKAALEDMARGDLGLNPPPPPPAPKTTAKQASARKKAAPAPPPPPPPAPLEDEQFRVFELAYGSGATLVLSAHTPGPLDQQKFITLVAQPDLYGSLVVLIKSVTDGAHLDEKPRMRLVDAVDAMADNRGELLFELRGTSERQFALYRVLRGQAEKLFVTGGGDLANETVN